MGDYLDAAKATIDAQKMALLNAIAQSGQAGRQAYEQGQAAIQSQQQATAQAALQRAAQLGAPAGATQGITDKVNAPSDLRLTNLQGAADSRAAIFNSARQANANFMTESGAAVPLLREITNRKVAELRAAAEEKAQARAFAAEEHQWRMEEHQAALDAAKAKTQTPAQLVTDMGGTDYVGKQLDDLSQPSSAQSKYAETEHTLYGTPNDPQGAEMAALEAHFGLPPGYGAQLAAKSKADAAAQDAALQRNTAGPEAKSDQQIGTAVGLSAQSVQHARTSDIYTKAQRAIQAQMDAGKSPSDIITLLRGSSDYSGHPKTIEVALRDLFPPAAFSGL